MSKPPSLIRTQFEFVLDYGWWYVPHSEHPLSMGPLQQCVGNAARASASDDGLIYCEGFALFKKSSNPVRHAWVTDGSGRAFDVTWSPPGVAYAGVPFKSFFVTMNAVKRRAFVTLLDDWEAGWPLLGKLGDTPDEWLETAAGNGAAKIARSRGGATRHSRT